jgi:ABC-type transport system involved in multi-copper enzyme maturation permease subunit
MIWLLWRQHRVQLAILVVLLGAFAAPVLITGMHLRSAFNACQASDGCGGNLLAGYNSVNTLVDVTILIPVVIGLFWGAGLVGRELENGTAALVWTQTVSKRHWLRAKLVTLFVASAVSGAAVSALVTWWSSTRNATVESRFGGLQFDIQGIAPVGYTLFASALGLTAGIVWRRTLPAMATTVGGFLAARMIIELFVRPHYMSPVVKLYPLKQIDPIPVGSLSISTDLLRNGHVVNGPIQVQCDGTREQMNACMDRLGYHVQATYQPAGRYWTFQWIEFGIFAGLTALLVIGGLVVLRRRDA